MAGAVFPLNIIIIRKVTKMHSGIEILKVSESEGFKSHFMVNSIRSFGNTQETKSVSPALPSQYLVYEVTGSRVSV